MLLRDKLSKNSILYSKFISLENNARHLLEYSQGGSHLQYTPHGLSHVTIVEDNYDWLLSEDIEKFSYTEIFILLSATYFHDAMMIPKYLGDEEKARASHAERANDFITKHYVELGLQLNEAVAIGHVIKGHSVDALDELQGSLVLGSDKIDIHKLVACLSISDICHADESRAPWIVKAHLEIDEESEYHWSRHLQISGITRDNEDLIMSAIVFSKEGEKAIYAYKEMIEKQLIICRPYFNTKLKPLNSVKLNITYLKSPLDQPLKFNTNMPEILNLLIEGVYSQEEVFIRELVQNSIDACTICRARSYQVNIHYQAKIILSIYTVDKQVRSVRIDDNGIGMSIKDVKDTLLWIGSSIGKNKDIETFVKENTGKQLIATFGIGLLSCFRVADYILVTSHKENESPLKLKLNGISDTITPKESNDLSVGSTFYIEFDSKKYTVTVEELMNIFSYYFRDVNQVELLCMEMPFDENAPTRSRENVFTIARSEAKEISHIATPLTNILYQKNIIGSNFNGLFWINKSNDEKLLSRKGKIQILSEGIFVKEDSVDNWLPSHMSVFEGKLNVSAKALDLTASRDSIKENHKSKMLRDELHKKSSSLFEGLVKKQSEELLLRSQLSLLIMDIIKRANKEYCDNLLRKLDLYCVKMSGVNKFVSLKDISNVVYVEYPIGRFVNELTEFEGKTLYHKDAELTQLQTALMRQKGEMVISAINNDLISYSSYESLNELELITKYCDLKNIKVIDLVAQNIIEGELRSKKLSSKSRELIGTRVKFVEIPELPNKKVCIVGEHVWVNLCNGFTKNLYDVLNDSNVNVTTKKVAKSIIDCLSYQFDDVISTLYDILKDNE